MDSVRATATYRQKCVQVECETTRRLITEILSNNFQVAEALLAFNSDDSNFVDECCDYLHHSQINILKANLLLQKFLKTPVPVRKNVRSVNYCEQSSNFNLDLNSISSPSIERLPLPLIECKRLHAVSPSVCESLIHSNEQVIIQDSPKTESKVNNHSSETVVTLEPEKDEHKEETEEAENKEQIEDENMEQVEEVTEEDENKKELEEVTEEDENKEQIEAPTEKDTFSSDFLNNGSNQSVQVVPSISEELIKTTYDFAQVPFKTENKQTTTKSHLKVIVKAKNVIPDKSIYLKEKTINYADILKKKEPNSSNMFYPNVDVQMKYNGVETWPSLKLSSSKKSSLNFVPKKKVPKRTEVSTKPNQSKRASFLKAPPKDNKLLDRKNCHQTRELKHSTNAEICESPAPPLVATKQDWWQDPKTTNCETYPSPSVEPKRKKSESSLSDDVPQTWDECLEDSPLDAASDLDNQTKAQIKSVDTDVISVCTLSLAPQTDSPQIQNHESPSKKDSSDFSESEPKKTSEWKSNAWGRRRKQDDNDLNPQIFKQTESRQIQNHESPLESPCKKDSTDFAEGDTKRTSEWKSNAWGRRRKIDNNGLNPQMCKQTDSPQIQIHESPLESPCKTDSTDFSKGETKRTEWETNTSGGRKIDNNIVNRLKRRDIVSVEERFKRSIPRARMPDISMKPSSIKLSQKQKSVLKTDSEEETDDVLDESSFYTDIKEDEGEVEVEVEEIMQAVPQALKPKSEDYFLISDIISPGFFYIQIANEISVLLDEIEAEIRRIVTSQNFPMFSSKFEAKKEMGNFVCTERKGYWLRVEVIDWCITSHKTNVHVQSIDYGGIYKTNYHALRPLPTEFFNIPRIAERCHLIDLYPINSITNSPGRRWEENSKSTFIKLCGDLATTEFELTNLKYCSIRKSYGIDFKTSDGKSVSDILVKRKLAIHIVNKKSDFFENLDLNASVGLDSHQMPMEQIWNAYWYKEHIARSANNHNASCNSSRTGTKYSNINEFVVMQPENDQDLPPIGVLRRVMITHVVDIETFYGHVDEVFEDYVVHPGESLHNLHEYMNKYTMVKEYTSLTCTPAVSQLVIAPHPIYLWSRAQVRQVGVPDKNDEVYAELFYIDYGCVNWVPLSAVRNMIKSLSKFPCLAIEFKMFNIEHRFGASRETEKEFLEMYLKEELFVVIKAVPGNVVVQLLDCFKIDIGETLINHGIGQWKKEQFYPNSDSCLLID